MAKGSSGFKAKGNPTKAGKADGAIRNLPKIEANGGSHSMVRQAGNGKFGK